MQLSGFAGKWKDQVVMEIEPAKFKSEETDDNNLNGDNSISSNDVMRFQYDLDVHENQSKYYGAGLLGGDLPGMMSKVSHLKSLGITSIILYPIMKSDENNYNVELPTGYGVSDWTSLDRNFRGSGQPECDNSSYIDLVKELHNEADGQPRINIFQDLPMTLIGNDHPWMLPLTAKLSTGMLRRFNPVDLYNNISTIKNIASTMCEYTKPYEFRLMIDISSSFNEDVFSHNSNMADGGMGDTGLSYPSECVGSFIEEYTGFIHNNNYKVGPKLDGCFNAVRGSCCNTNIEIPRSKYGALSLAAAATGSDRTADINIVYDDGSTTAIKNVNIPFWIPEAPPSEHLVEFDHIHSVKGEAVRKSAYMYSVFLEPDPARAVKAIELVGGKDMKDVHVFAVSGFPIVSHLKLDLTDYCNVDGYSREDKKGDGNLAGGLLFPVEGMKTYFTAVFRNPGSSKSLNNFAAGSTQNGRNNLVKCQGQTIPVQCIPYHVFRLAAFSISEPSADGEFTVNFVDGTTKSITLKIKSYENSFDPQTDILVHESKHAHSFDGTMWVKDRSRKLRIWGYELDLQDNLNNWNKPVKSIILPDNQYIHIAAINPVIILESSWGLPMLGSSESMADNEALYKYFQDKVIGYWMKLADIDGYRIDSAQNLLPEFWQKLNNYVKVTFPGKLMLGEAGIDEKHGPLSWQLHTEQYTNESDGVGFDALYDFESSVALRKVFALDMAANSKESGLIECSMEWDEKYEKPWNQMICFDCYENWSFFYELNNNVDKNGKPQYPDYMQQLPKLRLAAAYVLTINRVPLLFSGNEFLLQYGAFAPVGFKARKPGYLFSDEVKYNTVYQDNLRYIKALINMRKENAALRSEEKMTSEKWILQGSNLFGFIRQHVGSPAIAVFFNNSPKEARDVSVNLPEGLAGADNWNFIKKNIDGNYGSFDMDISWSGSSNMIISVMAPWEAKIIRI